MTILLHSMLALLTCVTVGGLSASSTSAQEAAVSPQIHEDREHPHHRYGTGQHHHHHLQAAGAGPDSVSLTAEGRLHHLSAERENQGIMRRESLEESARRAKLQKQEPVVHCGRHSASVCSACPDGKGRDWCHGDCIWDEDTDSCAWNTATTMITSTTNKYPAADEAADSDDEIASKLRAEEARTEKEEKQARQNFWITVGLAAGGSSLCVMACGITAICCCSAKKDPKAAAEVPLLEEEEEVEEEEEEAEAEESEEGEPAAAATPEF